MQYNGLAWAVALVALLVLLTGGHILLRRGWFLGWLRGSCGLGLLALAMAAGLMGWDLRSYATLPAPGETLLTLGVQAQGSQRYRVSLQERAQERSVILNGDLWQLDARVFGWKGLATLVGLQPGYRLELLTGRYGATAQQAGAEPSRVLLAQSPFGIDLWRWLRESGQDLFLFDARAARVTFLPLVDGALYSVRLTGTELLAEPLNQVAREALAQR